MTTTKLSLWLLALSTTGGVLRGIAHHLLGDGLPYTLVDAGTWAALVVFAAYTAHRVGYREAKDRYKTRLDNLVAILPGHGPEWEVYRKGKRIGAKSMRDRAFEETYSADSSKDACERIRALPLIYDREWVEATEEPR